MWLSNSFKITKNSIRAIISLCSFGDFPMLKFVKNQLVTNTIGSKFDKKEMTINYILGYDVKFASMVIGYKIYHSSGENSIFDTAIYAAHEMVKEIKQYDLCELLWSEIMENLVKIK